MYHPTAVNVLLQLCRWTQPKHLRGGCFESWFVTLLMHPTMLRQFQSLLYGSNYFCVNKGESEKKAPPGKLRGTGNGECCHKSWLKHCQVTQSKVCCKKPYCKWLIYNTVWASIYFFRKIHSFSLKFQHVIAPKSEVTYTSLWWCWNQYDSLIFFFLLGCNAIQVVSFENEW